MNISDKQFQAFLAKLPSSLQESIEEAINTLIPNIESIDEDFLNILQETNLELYNSIKKGMLALENQPKQELKVKFFNKEFKDFKFLNFEEEEIIIWQGNFITDTNILINSSNIVIIDGNLKCNNLIIDDSYLFINGDLNCNILFGASGNDKMTQITKDIKTKAIVENGHFTNIEGNIYCEDIIMIHNEIKCTKEVIANKVFETNIEGKYTLANTITDEKGFFDEEKFLYLINSDQSFKLLL